MEPHFEFDQTRNAAFCSFAALSEGSPVERAFCGKALVASQVQGVIRSRLRVLISRDRGLTSEEGKLKHRKTYDRIPFSPETFLRFGRRKPRSSSLF